MLSVGWDEKGIPYYELLRPHQTVNADLYQQQLMRLSEAIEEKRPLQGHQKLKVIQINDNARPHIAISTRQTIMELGWEVLPQSVCTPDLAPSVNHLIRSPEHFTGYKTFTDADDVKKTVHSFFDSKHKKSYRDEIAQLPIRCQKFTDNNDNYFVQ